MPRPSWKRTARLVLKTTLAVVVLAAVGRQVVNTWRDLHQPGRSLRIDARWLIAAGLVYLLGLAACGVFYGRVLRESAHPVTMGAAVRAYLISHLGKYVPGKAVVVVMRVGLSSAYGARPATATIATFYETLVMMASGSALAVVGFAASRPVRTDVLLFSAALTAAFLVVVDPLVFPRVSGRLSSKVAGVGADAMPRFTRRLLAEGMALTLLGWALLGLSQIAVVRALVPDGVTPAAWPLVLAGVALATVSGFVVAVLPGGLGVREWVLMNTLTPALGTDLAVVAALVLRLTWVVAEVSAAALLTVVRPAGATPYLPEVSISPEPVLSRSSPRPSSPESS